MEDDNIVNLEGDSGDNPNLENTSEKRSFSSIHVIVLGITIGFIKSVFFEGIRDDLGMIIDTVAILLIIVGIIRIFKDGIQ